LRFSCAGKPATEQRNAFLLPKRLLQWQQSGGRFKHSMEASGLPNNPTDFGRIRAYYARFDEWGRLETPAGAFEFERSLELIDRHLRVACRILDLGGGPGRYAIALADRGHTVTLADVSPELLENAREKIAEANATGIEAVVEANAVDLGRWEAMSFDAVLAFGPFYHLTDAQQRNRAMSEIHRVLKPAGKVFAAFVPRLSGLAGLIQRAASSPEQVTADAFAAAVEDGSFRNTADSGFQEGHYAEPEEMAELLVNAGFEVTEMVSLRGLAYTHEEDVERIRSQDTTLHREIVAAIDSLASDPRVVATCGHAIAVGKKPAVEPKAMTP
jgi:S-adenosylmethionine-dependent methyltransferase